MDLSLNRLRECLSYNADTGVFMWRIGLSIGTVSGTTAGTKGPDGYVAIKIDGRRYYANVLAWFYCYGTYPKSIVDHINNLRSDNRLANLRLATKSQNNMNRCSNNPLGYRGVCKRPSGRYSAGIKYGGKPIYLGTFDTIEEAHDAYMAAATMYYGEFARAS